MKRTFINAKACISTQLRDGHDNVFPSPPDYKKHIKPANRRRMSKVVKMGVAASAMALEEAGMENPDAIIVGTGMGCRQDTETFLEGMLENDEQFLTPTKFIQSTHNTIAGQIALERNCNAYNFTYVQNAASFESALMDAQLSLGNGMKNILVGGLDETAENALKLFVLNGHFSSVEAFESEGAAFFVLSNEKTENTYAELKDVMTWNQASTEEMEKNILGFLERNGLQPKDLGAVVLGNNGDSEFDGFYHYHQEHIFKNIPQLAYKHLTGEFNTSSALGMWLGAKVLKSGQIPEAVRMNDKIPAGVYPAFHCGAGIQLHYNQYRGREHSLILLKGT